MDAVIDMLLATCLLAATFAADSSRASNFASGADSARVVPIPGIAIERDRAVSNARRRHPTASLTELTPRAGTRATPTLPELLAESPGAHVVQYGGLGAFSTVSLRGAPSNQVAVYLDGVPLTTAAYGTANLADVPLGDIERIEVWRGASPLLMGVAPGGGALNLVSHEIGARSLEARAARGGFETWDAAVAMGGRRGPLATRLAAGRLSTAGGFEYLDDNGTPFNANDDSLHARLNNRLESWQVMASATFDARRWRLTAREHWQRKDQGVPGLGAVPALATRLEREQFVTQLEAARPGHGAMPSLRALLAHTDTRDRFSDPRAELGLGRHDSNDRTRGAGAHLEFGWEDLPAGFAAQAAADARRDDARLRDALDPWADPPGSRRDVLGGAVAVQWRSPVDRLLLHSATRWDRFDDALASAGTLGTRITRVTRDFTSPQLGARLSLPAGLAARANWSRAERAPDFCELFGNQGSVLGSATLTPERSEAWDAGFEWAQRSVSAAWSHFESQHRDLIVYVRVSQSSVRAQNVSSARISGDEWSVHGRLPLGFAVTGSFTSQRAIDTGPVVYWNGRRLPQRPARQGYARLDWARHGFGAALDLQWIDDNPLDRYNRYSVEARRLLGARLAAPLAVGGLRAVLEGRNLTNDRATDVAGFPLPGRSLTIACEARLASDAPSRP
ncbi:MAG: TonB-dependent receptor [Candidatus Eisenbacteria bacterium]|uniref:TonB-dependent receptor n=1 Tax=Eiseniibacteriota bacterium TaxID=2212470 RepID=A0A849SRV4_UNCEI|nr:TonB-dependent receptor [Candidatus Eisenbacteria bacterium]